jgi:DNA-binding winged helix-turn-helix (wHTH) protein
MMSKVTSAMRPGSPSAPEGRRYRANLHLAASPTAYPDIDQHVSQDANWIGGSLGSVILFGPFRLLPTERLLLEHDKPVGLGSRAFDILIALVERPGELLSNQELMARVWPNTFVVPANLTVHIAALRRALGDGRGGNRYLINIPGRGYQFVAPMSVQRSLGAWTTRW